MTSQERYLAKFDELNIIATRYAVGGIPRKQAVRDFHDWLLDAYIEGWSYAVSVFEDISFMDAEKQTYGTKEQTKTGNDSAKYSNGSTNTGNDEVKSWNDVIKPGNDEVKPGGSTSGISFNPESAEASYNKTYDGESIEKKFEKYFDTHSEEELKRLLDTEFHRMYNEGSMQAATSYQDASGAYVLKRWVTMLDDKVRETHDYLEGVEVPLGDEFITFDGDSAMAPGGFANPSNNINCRCILSYSAV